MWACSAAGGIGGDGGEPIPQQGGEENLLCSRSGRHPRGDKGDLYRRRSDRHPRDDAGGQLTGRTGRAPEGEWGGLPPHCRQCYCCRLTDKKGKPSLSPEATSRTTQEGEE